MSEGYQVVQLKNGSWSVRALAEAETFHPVIGPVAEAEALYVHQLELSGRIAAHRGAEFVLWDVGLGAAANVLTALRALAGQEASVRVVSFDRTREPLRFASEHADRLEYLSEFLAPVRELISAGRVAFRHGGLRVDWELVEADFPTWVQGSPKLSERAPHAILFDAYSPARNPSMWTLPVFEALHRHTDPDRPCALATYSRATFVRASLLLAGWFVGVGHATGEKDETTVAATRLDLIREPLGRSWIERASRSTSAQPLNTPEYRQRPLSLESRARLDRHPQFAT